MRLDKLELRNFKKFQEATFECPRAADASAGSASFHVLVGENGSGKTSILDALAVALGIEKSDEPPASIRQWRVVPRE